MSNKRAKRLTRQCGRCMNDLPLSHFATKGYICHKCRKEKAEEAAERRAESKRECTKEWVQRNRVKFNERKAIEGKAKKLGVPTMELREVLEWWDNYKEKRKEKQNANNV